MAVGIDIAQNAAGQHLRPWRTIQRRHHNVHRHRPHAKIRLYVRRQARTHHGKTISPIHRCRRERRRWSHTSRHTSLPINEHHPTRVLLSTRGQPVHIHPSRHRLTRRIRRIPSHRVKTRRPLLIYQRRNPLPQHIEHLQPHRRSRRQLIRNNRRRIERIRIILPQRKPLWQGRTAQQRQREIALCIGRRPRHRSASQIRQIEQQHLRRCCRLTRSKTHPPLHQRLGDRRGRQRQPNQNGD